MNTAFSPSRRLQLGIGVERTENVEHEASNKSTCSSSADDIEQTSGLRNDTEGRVLSGWT